MLAAAMWISVQTQCPTCTVIAGDFGGAGSHDYSYLKLYGGYLKSHGYQPPVWGIGANNDALIVPVKQKGKWHWTAEPAYQAVAGILRSWQSAPAQAPVPAAPSSAAAVAAYEIRNAADGLCLDVNDRGASAGRNGDKVQLWDCYGGTNYGGGSQLWSAVAA